MTAKVEVILSAKDAEMVAAWQRAKASIGSFQDALAKTEGINQRLEISGRRVWEQTRTPLERFKATVKELSSQFQANIIDQETYGRAIAQANARLAESDESLKRLTADNQALEVAGKRVWEQTRTPLERYNAEMVRLQELRAKGKIDDEAYSRAAQQQKTILDQSDESLKRLTADNQALEAAGKRVWEQMRTPLERYNAEIARLSELLQTGKINQETYNRAAQQQKVILDQSDESLRRLAADNQALEVSGKRVWEQTRTPLERYNAEMARLSELRAKGKIDDDTHARAVREQTKLYQQAENAGGSYLATISSGTIQVLGTLTGVGTVIGGIAAIAGQLRAEYDNLVSRQKTAADKQIDTAAAQRAAIGNLGKDPTMNADQLNSEIEKISAETGVAPKDLFLAASSALSARGQLPAKAALDAIRMSAINSPDDTSGLAVTAGALLDLQKKAGGNAKTNMGMILGGKQAARVESTQAFAQNVIPAAFQLQDFGDTQQEAMALMAMLTQSMGDTQGSMAGTAAIQLAKQLKEAMPKLGSTTARIKALQSDPKYAGLKKKLLGTGKGALVGEAKAYTTYQGLLKGKDTTQGQLFETALGAVPTVATAEKVFDETQAAVNAQPIQQTATVNRAISTAADRVSLRDITGGLSGVSREGLQKILKASGVSKTGQDFIGTQFEVATQMNGVNPLEFVAKEAERRGQSLTTAVPETSIAFAGPEGSGTDAILPGRERTAAEVRQGQEFLELANLLRKQNEILQKQLDAQNEAAKQKPPTVTVNVDGKPQPKIKPSLPVAPRPAEALNAKGGK